MVSKKEVSRDKGFLAVEARTNVEVEETVCNGMAVIDINEIPDRLFELSTNPVLLGYKFLNTNYQLSLNVKKHADVGVLIAVVDSALFTATYSQEGSILYRMLLQIRNTQRQYVRISISSSSDYEIWSTLVAGSAVKPAKDSGTGMLMIPLKKSSKTDTTDASFQVELIYMIKSESLSGRGIISVELPYCDIPINQLFVNLFLPTSFKYGEFTGMREVQQWTSAVPYSQSSSGENTRVARAPQVQMSNLASNPLYMDDMMEKLDEMPRSRGMNKKKGGFGVLPVKVNVPTTGLDFKFEQLLVSEKHLTLTTDYRQFDKESVRRKNRCC